MQVIYIILASTLISGLFCFAFFFGFSLGLKQAIKQAPKEEKEVVLKDEKEVEAYKHVQQWLNYTGQ